MFIWNLVLMLVFTLGTIVLALGGLLAKSKTSSEAYLSPFECGFGSLMEWRKAFSIQFFLLALIFLVFDVELILLFPALALETSSLFLAQSMIFFIVFILSLGLFIEWKNSVLEWLY